MRCRSLAHYAAECCHATPNPPAPLTGGGRDLESQYTTAHGELGTGSETRSLREKYGSMSSLGTGGQPTPPTQSAGPSAAPSAAPSAGTVSSGGGRRAMRGASQEALALRSSQQAFRGLAAGVSQLSRGDSQLHSTGSMAGPARTRSTAGAPNPLRQSLTASTGCNGGSTLSGSVLAASAAGAAAGATFASATPVLGDAHYTLKSTSSSGRGGSRPDSAANSSSNNSGERGGCELRGWLPLSCDAQPHRQCMEDMVALNSPRPPAPCPSAFLPQAPAPATPSQLRLRWTPPTWWLRAPPWLRPPPWRCTPSCRRTPPCRCPPHKWGAGRPPLHTWRA